MKVNYLSGGRDRDEFIVGKERISFIISWWNVLKQGSGNECTSHWIY